MKPLVLLVILICSFTKSIAAEQIDSFSDAKRVWKGITKSKEYRAYVDANLKSDIEFKPDEKRACFGLESKQVELLLVIEHSGANTDAIVVNVLSDSQGPKAECFRKLYVGARVNIPPFVPFVKQMTME